jgi:hypothetical protein
MRNTLLAVLILIPVSCWGQTPYDDFKDACLMAFSKSAGSDTPTGSSVCGCTAEESKHQGVTVSELKKETAEIRRDPKYKIQNKKLLDSFHYCIVSAMHDAEHPH